MFGSSSNLYSSLMYQVLHSSLTLMSPKIILEPFLSKTNYLDHTLVRDRWTDCDCRCCTSSSWEKRIPRYSRCMIALKRTGNSDKVGISVLSWKLLVFSTFFWKTKNVCITMLWVLVRNLLKNSSYAMGTSFLFVIRLQCLSLHVESTVMKFCWSVLQTCCFPKLLFLTSPIL